MILELIEDPHGIQKRGQFLVDLIAGEKIRVEIGQEDELSITVPEGQKWKGLIVVDFMEIDA